ncbi:MAG: hypothetical protein EBZ77_11820 [Chitinophagia bacterium]|nr:hypothetical protein [Chitinophagia bacterium]
MSRNAAIIKAALRQMATDGVAIVNGTVVAGSYNATEQTITVQTGSDAIEGVRLYPITGSTAGLLLQPADGSEVTIGTIDGPGEWIVLRTSVLEQLSFVRDNVSVVADSHSVKVANNGVEWEAGSSVMALRTPSESLYQVLKDLLTYLQALTVSTAMGPSGPPLNISDFIALSARLDHLLAA